MGKERFQRNLDEHMETARKTAALAGVVEEAASLMIAAIEASGRVFFCGNGGSAADAQHLASELSGRYLRERAPMDAVALHCNTSAVTAIANDYGYEEIYARQIQAHGRKGDVLAAISTSGNSANINKAAQAAREIGIKVIAMTGESGGALKNFADILITVPSASTPRIQEMHILIGHALCEIVEASAKS